VADAFNELFPGAITKPLEGTLNLSTVLKNTKNSSKETHATTPNSVQSTLGNRITTPTKVTFTVVGVPFFKFKKGLSDW
jgi:hypothetical protein